MLNFEEVFSSVCLCVLRKRQTIEKKIIDVFNISWVHLALINAENKHFKKNKIKMPIEMLDSLEIYYTCVQAQSFAYQQQVSK